MATKPTETLTFEPPDASVVAIPSAKQAAGFLPGERPPAQYLSWLFRTLSRLYNYVKDGQFTGNHSIAGTLAVIGGVTTTAAAGSGPLLSRDSAGRDRFAVDRLGLPAGAISEHVQSWPLTTVPTDWVVAYTAGSGATVAISDPLASPSVPWRSCLITIAAANTRTLRGPYVIRMTTKTAIAVDAAIVWTGTGTSIFFGLWHAVRGDYAGVQVTSSGAYAYLYGETPVAISGAWVSGGINYVTVEFEGSEVSGLSANVYRLRVVVNGVASAYVTTNGLSDANSIAPSFSGKSDDASTGALYVGGVRAQWITRVG